MSVPFEAIQGPVITVIGTEVSTCTGITAGSAMASPENMVRKVNDILLGPDFSIF